jgi:hypothetical protein
MSKTCRDCRANKDFFGSDFKVGDIVACLKPGTGTSWLVYGVVLKLSEKTSLIFTDRNYEGKYDLKKLCEAYLRDWTANGEDVDTMIKRGYGVNRRDNKNIVKHPANWTITGLILNKGIYDFV